MRVIESVREKKKEEELKRIPCLGVAKTTEGI